jgi:hypothetical protein
MPFTTKKGMVSMRAGILLLLWILFPAGAMANDQTLQLFHEVRTRSYLLCSSAMLYFSPAIKLPDPRALISNYDSLMLLQTRTVQLGQPPYLVEIQRSMQGLMEALEQIPAPGRCLGRSTISPAQWCDL